MIKKILCFSATAVLIAGCSLAPEFELPSLAMPSMFKEDASRAHIVEGVYWKQAEHLEQSDRGEWWKVFGQAQLDYLQKQALENNQTLQAAMARLDQARAQARIAGADFLPRIDAGANALRAQASSNSSAAALNAGNSAPYSSIAAQGVVSYEADLFGRVRDTDRAARFDADAQEAAYRSVLLALQADVAQNYYALRALDSERQLLRDTVKLRQEAARIMQRRFDEGDVGMADLTRIQSDLASVEAELIALDRARSALENALAVLLGQMPSSFSFAEAPLMEEVPPKIPPGLPSALLQRRPDIATAQFNMASANARIGAARAAFFPQLFLTASGGFEAATVGDLFEWSSRTWALGQLAGMALNMPIFDGGRNQAGVDAAQARYAESIANYKQQILTAFRDVEDNLSAQRLLVEQQVKQRQAAATSKQTTDVTQKRFDEGDVDYFQVVDAQRVSLAAERAAVQIQGQRMIAAVELIRALGGGWQDKK